MVMPQPLIAAVTDGRSSRRLPIVVGAVALLIALAGGGWWVTHPQRLAGLGPGVAVDAEGFVGKPIVVGMFAYPSEGSVRLRSATARVARGSAAAEVRALYCVQPPRGATIGSVRTTAAAACEQTPPPNGQRLAEPDWEAGSAQIVLEIVPLEPGTVTVDGVDVAYSAGLQRGRQSSGLRVRVEARG
jgi:hypothetical protein